MQAMSKAYLLTDNWDDWFKYSTLYSLVVFDEDGERHSIWPAAGFVDTEIRCFDEAGGGRCNDGNSGVSSRSRRYG